MGLSAALKNTATRAQHGGFAGRSALSQRLARPTTPLGTENDCPAVGFRRNSRQTACHLGNVCFFFWLVGLGMVVGAELNAALAETPEERDAVGQADDRARRARRMSIEQEGA